MLCNIWALKFVMSTMLEKVRVRVAVVEALVIPYMKSQSKVSKGILEVTGSLGATDHENSNRHELNFHNLVTG